MDTQVYKNPLESSLDTGANLKHGLSVWAPIILNPVLFGSNY